MFRMLFVVCELPAHTCARTWAGRVDRRLKGVVRGMGSRVCDASAGVAVVADAAIAVDAAYLFFRADII